MKNYWMKYIKLKVQCFVIYWLQRFYIIKRVWHKCEIELAKLEADKLMKKLGLKDESD